MERVAYLVLVTLAMSNATSAEDNTTTLEELFLKHYGQTLHKIMLHLWSKFAALVDYSIRSHAEPFTGKLNWLPLTKEFILYFEELTFKIISELESDLGNATLKSIYKDLNDHCSEYLETPIVDLTVKPSNVTCVVMQLWKRITLNLKIHFDVGLQKLSRECAQQLLPLCKAVPANCTLAYEEQVGKMLGDYVGDAYDLFRDQDFGSIPLVIITLLLDKYLSYLGIPYNTAFSFLALMTVHISSAPSIEPFALTNLVRPKTEQEIETAYFKEDSATQTQERFSWGIVRSDLGSMSRPCTNYRDVYPKDSKQYSNLRNRCSYVNFYQSTLELIRCSYTDQTSTPLTWSTVSSAYFDSQCLCVAYNRTECGVKAPRGTDPRLYCLSVLLNDFQRQVSYRPAVTYLDYAFQTRLPICQFTNLLQLGFKTTCYGSGYNINFNYIISMQCYFKSLVNKHLNCSETPLVHTYNATLLCARQLFMEFVLCEGADDIDVHVPYYGPGGSTLVLFLTYLEVAVRVLTLVTYLACPELRNLLGKLLIGYQVTALLRILVVRASLQYFALAVRLDVATDLASTLWLTSYLHFLTESIKALRLPDSLSPAEARMVLLRYALLGWALPVVLSVAFFCMDEFLDSHVQFGQLFFVLCNFVALFGNIFMFFLNCNYYRDLKSGAISFKLGVSACSDFADLFMFALKTSLMSGAGITFRLLFMQIQGLEHLLGFYHALSTLQGLLFFVLYGCNREGRAFWQGVVSTLPLCTRRQNTPI